MGGADLLVRPLLRVAELLEAIPGLIAAQHSGGGKANQYFLRGFNLDHGTDFTTYVDGVPWNLRSHGHGQGLSRHQRADPTRSSIASTTARTAYRADVGDFALAGSSFMAAVIDRLKAPFAAVEGGEYGWFRLAGGSHPGFGGGGATTLAQIKTYDGPWQGPEDLRHGSVWTKYVAGHCNWSPGGLAVRLPRQMEIRQEQSSEVAIGTPACPRNTFAHWTRLPSAATDRWILTSRLEAQKWPAGAYAQYYDWHMVSIPPTTSRSTSSIAAGPWGARRSASSSTGVPSS